MAPEPSEASLSGDRGPSPWPARLARALRWLATAVLALLTLRLIASDPEPLRELLRVDAWTLAALVTLIVANQWLMALRFKLVMKQYTGVEMSQAGWFRLTSVGQFLNLFVPQLGHLHRALVLKREFGTPYSAYAGGIFVFFWFELTTSIALAILTVAVWNPEFRLARAPVILVLLAGGLTMLVSPLCFEWLFSRVHHRGAFRAWAERMTQSFFNVRRASRDVRFVLRFSAVNTVVAAGQIVTLWLAFDAVGSHLGIGTLMVFQVLLKLSNHVAITPGNLGVTELAYGVLADAAAGGAQEGIAAALLIRSLSTSTMLALGWVLGGGRALLGRRTAGPQAPTEKDL